MIKKSFRISKFLVFVFLLAVIASCSKDSNQPEIEIIDTDGDKIPDDEDDCPDVAGLISLNGCPEEVIVGDVWTVNKDNQQALNVVYFIPTDLDKEEEEINVYIDNISKMMLYIQSWYGMQMNYQDYDEKTFGLITNQDSKVRVHVIKGENESSYYARESEKVETEVKAYFAINPELSSSAHAIILGDGQSQIGVEARGKWGFVTVSSFELTETDLYFNDFRLYTSTNLTQIMHELGHALNLPHNCQNATDISKVALMSYGNNDPSASFLTKSDCAILDTNILFNKTDNGISYYGSSPQIDLKTISFDKDIASNTIKISGTYTSNIEILYNYVGFDFVNDDQAHPNDNYDEITFTKAATKNNEGDYAFDFEIPYSELFNSYQTFNKDEAIIELNVVSETGILKFVYSHYYTTDLSTEIPNDDIVLNYFNFEFSDRSNWTISVNTTSVTGSETRIIDGNINSYWHSYWPYNFTANGPHEINIDMGEVKDVNGLYFLSERSGVQWRPKHILIESSTDSVNWNTAGSTTIKSVYNAKELTLDLDENNQGIRYIRITVDEIYTTATTSAQNLIFSEIDVY